MRCSVPAGGARKTERILRQPATGQMMGTLSSRRQLTVAAPPVQTIGGQAEVTQVGAKGEPRLGGGAKALQRRRCTMKTRLCHPDRPMSQWLAGCLRAIGCLEPATDRESRSVGQRQFDYRVGLHLHAHSSLHITLHMAWTSVRGGTAIREPFRAPMFFTLGDEAIKRQASKLRARSEAELRSHRGILPSRCIKRIFLRVSEGCNRAWLSYNAICGLIYRFSSIKKNVKSVSCSQRLWYLRSE